MVVDDPVQLGSLGIDRLIVDFEPDGFVRDIVDDALQLVQVFGSPYDHQIACGPRRRDVVPLRRQIGSRSVDPKSNSLNVSGFHVQRIAVGQLDDRFARCDGVLDRLDLRSVDQLNPNG